MSKIAKDPKKITIDFKIKFYKHFLEKLTTMQKSENELSQLMEKMKLFAQNNKLSLVYQFGSQVSKTNTNFKSDYDFALLLDDKISSLSTSVFFKASLISKLEQLLKITPVDLVILNIAPPILSYDIIKFGILLYKNNDAIRSDFEAKTVRSYLDFRFYNDLFNFIYLNSLKVNGVL